MYGDMILAWSFFFVYRHKNDQAKMTSPNNPNRAEVLARPALYIEPVGRSNYPAPDSVIHRGQRTI